jgi:hypothetical protein
MDGYSVQPVHLFGSLNLNQMSLERNHEDSSEVSFSYWNNFQPVAVSGSSLRHCEQVLLLIVELLFSILSCWWMDCSVDEQIETFIWIMGLSFSLNTFLHTNWCAACIHLLWLLNLLWAVENVLCLQFSLSVENARKLAVSGNVPGSSP